MASKPKPGSLALGANGIGENPDAELISIGLTAREIQILRHLALGKGDKKIAAECLISVKTVNHHVSNIMVKLNAKNRTHAVAKALLAGQVEMRASDRPPPIAKRRLEDLVKSLDGIAVNTEWAGASVPALARTEKSTPSHPHLDIAIVAIDIGNLPDVGVA